jgi:hypothetical protein
MRDENTMRRTKKEYQKEKCGCGCGSKYNLSTKARHGRTKKHIEHIKCQESN